MLIGHLVRRLSFSRIEDDIQMAGLINFKNSPLQCNIGFSVDILSPQKRPSTRPFISHFFASLEVDMFALLQ
jgi:hypothetical protein